MDMLLPHDDELLHKEPPLMGKQKERIQFLARVLAHGAIMDYWTPHVSVEPMYASSEPDSAGGVSSWLIGERWSSQGHPNYDTRLNSYLEKVWGYLQPQASFLEAFGYLASRGNRTIAPAHHMPREISDYIITPKAFALLDIPLEHRVFVSYRRSESSAFALLLYDRLRSAGFDVFVDKRNIEPGEIWLKRLKDAIVATDVFICLVGKTTLDSENVMIEIKWALDNEIPAIPIWHNRFRYEEGTYPEFHDFLKDTNAIIVDEDVLSYDNAIIQLLQFLQKPR